MQITKSHFKSYAADVGATDAAPQDESAVKGLTDEFIRADQSSAPAINRLADIYTMDMPSERANNAQPVNEDGLLSNSPDRRTPSLDYLLQNYEKLPLEIIEKNYQAAQEKFYQEKTALTERLQGASAEEGYKINQSLRQVNRDLTYVQQDLDRLATLTASKTEVWKNEMMALGKDYKHPELADLDGNGWIGRPNDPN